MLILEEFIEYSDPGPIVETSVPLMERGKGGKFAQWTGIGKSLEQRIQEKRNGIGRQSRPYIGE